MFKATCVWNNTTASKKITRTNRYNEESCQSGRHTPNTGISSKTTLPYKLCLKRQVYDSWVLLAMAYGVETWTLTKQAKNKLAAAQTKMERSMLNITYKNRKTNIWVRERTEVIDIIGNVRKMKRSWAGHINRLKLQRRPMHLMCDYLDTI